MKKTILFSLKSPYREQLDIIGFRFGHGRKALAIVGAMCWAGYTTRWTASLSTR